MVMMAVDKDGDKDGDNDSRTRLSGIGRWAPLAGDALLDRLRNTGRPRPHADPELVRLLQDLLEQGLEGIDRSGHTHRGSTGDVAPLVVTKDGLNRALAGESHLAADRFGRRAPGLALACGALIDVLFRQLVTVGTIGDAMDDGLAALSVDDHQRDLVAWIDGLTGSERAALTSEVERQASALVERWPTLHPQWLPRTQSPIRASLGGGTIELSARVDLAIGRPPIDVASVGIVEIKSGARRAEHRADLHFSALIETLRSPAPPFVVATYYTRTGELDVDPVDQHLLTASAQRTLAGIRSLRPAEGS